MTRHHPAADPSAGARAHGDAMGRRRTMSDAASGSRSADLQGRLARLAAPAPTGLAAAVLAQLGLPDIEDVDSFVLLDGPAGPLFLAFNAHGISQVHPAGLVDGDPERFAEEFQRRHGRPARPAQQPPAGVRSALRTGRGGDLRFDLRQLTAFERAVLSKALEIPPGEARPYAWIAREIGRPAAVRAVGSALGRNPVPVLVPCHRVVRSDGQVGEYAFGAAMKRSLLVTEGVNLDDLRALASRGLHYVGSDATGVFCIPTCPNARRIGAAHRTSFRTAGDAARAGYRPCRHCRPAPVQPASLT